MCRRLLLLGVLLAACTEEPPPSNAINPDRVTVFFPIDGRVYGRGFEGATSSPWVHIAAHPSETFTDVPVDEGTFEFDLFVLAQGNNVLEISGASDRTAKERTDPVFIPIPEPTNPDVPRFFCCMETGVCQSEFYAGETCREPTGGVPRCDRHADCYPLANEVLSIDPETFLITAPDPERRTRISGTTLPRALLTIENRALTGVGLSPRREWSVTTISDENGAFSIPSQRARGDDEIVFQLRDLDNLKSPPASRLVPDAELADLHVSIDAYEPLNANSRGRFALRLTPIGVDGRGICPNSTEAPTTCFTGGLTHADVNLTAELDNAPLDLVPATPTPEEPDIVGPQGDVRDGPRDYVLVMDLSAASAAVDPAPPRRFADAANAVARFRANDRVGLVAIGDPTEVEVGPRQAVLDALIDLETATPAGDRDIFEAILRAQVLLRGAPDPQPGRILVIATGDDVSDGIPAIERASAVRASLDADVRVDVVTVALAKDREPLLRITQFTQGELREASDVAQLSAELIDLAQNLVGSFVLLYEADIPNVEKQECVSLMLTVNVGGTRVERMHQNIVLFEGGAGVGAASCK